MIRIVSRLVVKKEHIAKFQELAKELVDGTRTEAGCIIYELNQSIKDERIHCFTEDWKDQAAIDSHNASPHFTKIVPQFAPLLEGEGMLDLYRIVF